MKKTIKPETGETIPTKKDEKGHLPKFLRLHVHKDAEKDHLIL